MKNFKLNSETVILKIYGITDLLSHLPKEVSLEENQFWVGFFFYFLI